MYTTSNTPIKGNLVGKPPNIPQSHHHVNHIIHVHWDLEQLRSGSAPAVPNKICTTAPAMWKPHPVPNTTMTSHAALRNLGCSSKSGMQQLSRSSQAIYCHKNWRELVNFCTFSPVACAATVGERCTSSIFCTFLAHSTVECIRLFLVPKGKMVSKRNSGDSLSLACYTVPPAPHQTSIVPINSTTGSHTIQNDTQSSAVCRTYCTAVDTWGHISSHELYHLSTKHTMHDSKGEVPWIRAGFWHSSAKPLNPCSESLVKHLGIRIAIQESLLKIACSHGSWDMQWIMTQHDPATFYKNAVVLLMH